MSNGWAIAGKKGPNENSWMMCERFITASQIKSCVNHNLEFALEGIGPDVEVESIERQRERER
jgi:hypothetical protein